MGRNDFERRRLRDIYDRNVRRVRALAEARDGRRLDIHDDVAAPRRFVVSEQRTRAEGFGRGGRQVRQSRSGAGRSRSRFSDKGVYRRGAMDRFAREDDIERALRRERLRERQILDGPRFGRGRLRLTRGERRELRRLRELRSLRKVLKTRGRWGAGADADRQLREKRRGGRREKQGSWATKEQLDAELDRFRGGN